MSGLKNLITDRPLTMLAWASALHSMWIGLGYWFSWQAATNTVLFASLSPAVFGFLLVLASIITMLGLWRCWKEAVVLGSEGQAFLWLYACMAYVMAGQWFFAIGVGFFYSFISGYVSFAMRQFVFTKKGGGSRKNEPTQ